MPKHTHKRHRRHKRKSRTYGKSRTRGGSYSMGPSVVSAGNLVVGRNLIGPDCVASERPGMLSYVSRGGLPGMSGGAQLCSPGMPAVPKQAGGRYQMSLEGAPHSGLLDAVRIPCEVSRGNPLNQRGGVQGAPDIRYEAPTAGYGNTVVQGAGQPLMIQTPYAAKAMNPSCLTVGGRRRKATRKAKSRRRH